jgi:hypothetical protein
MHYLKLLVHRVANSITEMRIQRAREGSNYLQSPRYKRFHSSLVLLLKFFRSCPDVFMQPANPTRGAVPPPSMARLRAGRLRAVVV